MRIPRSQIYINMRIFWHPDALNFPFSICCEWVKQTICKNVILIICINHNYTRAPHCKYNNIQALCYPTSSRFPKNANDWIFKMLFPHQITYTIASGSNIWCFTKSTLFQNNWLMSLNFSRGTPAEKRWSYPLQLDQHARDYSCSCFVYVYIKYNVIRRYGIINMNNYYLIYDSLIYSFHIYFSR